MKKRGLDIDLGLPKMDISIGDLGFGTSSSRKNKNNSMLFGLGDFSMDLSNTITDTRQDYDNLRKSARQMKKDIEPSVTKLKQNSKRFSSILKKNYIPKSNQSYFVLTNRNGVIIKHPYQNPTAAKRFMELAKASGSYDNVSEVQIEPR